MVHFPETYSDDDDDDDDDDVIITSGLQHSLKIRNYASASSSPNATHDYDNNDDMHHPLPITVLLVTAVVV